MALQRGATIRIHDSQAIGDSNVFPGVLSPDGTRVLFSSVTTNLVPGDTNGIRDILVANFATGAITRVSAAADGTEANDESYPFPNPFSPDGSRVLFASGATNLVPGDTNACWDIFVKDLATGTVTRVNAAADGTQPSWSWSFNPIFFPDGTRVLFESSAANLVPGDTNEADDLFIKDLATGAVTRVNTAADGTQANAGGLIVDCNTPRISADGTLVLFASPASNLVPNDTNGGWDLFLKNLATGAITRVNTAADGTQARGETNNLFLFGLSADGTNVLFYSEADNLAPDEDNVPSYLFLKNLVSGAITGLSNLADAAKAMGSSAFLPNQLSADANRVLFSRNPATGAIARVDTFFHIPDATRADQSQARPGTTPFTFTVTRTGDITGAATVAWSIAGTGPVPVDATNFAGDTLPSGMLTFAAGQAAQTFTAHVAHNSVSEADAYFLVTLANADTGTRLLSAMGIIGSDETLLEQVATGTGVTMIDDDVTPYTGPVAGIDKQWHRDGAIALNAVATTPNWFIHTGGGDDSIVVLTGTNVLDGGAGSNFLTGGTGADTFFIAAANQPSPTWSTIASFGASDAATIWGIDEANFVLEWRDGLGARGFTGLTLHVTSPGTPTAALTLAGYTTADLTNGTLVRSFGFDPVSGSHYLYLAHS